ncbi:MAG TPA: FAD-binding oxidoreductase, partial [Acidimicrobiales bacterium]
EIVGREHVLVDADIRAGYEVDWTGRFRGEALAVARPGSLDEVVAVVSWCARERVGIVPQGGNTGLVGGSVPGAGEPPVVLSLRRLDHIEPVDTAAAQVTAGAGVTLAALHEHARTVGLAFGVDLAARDSATVGGLVATNAGGVRVLRHGTMRTQVLGVEAVLGDGSVVRHLGGLVKDNTGYDLAGLLVGSEGTLGIVTAARLRLVPDPPDRLVVLVACPSVADAVALSAALRARLDGLEALEAVMAPCLSVAAERLGLAAAFDPEPECTLLVEWGGWGEPSAALMDLVGEREAVAAADVAGRARLWHLRERMTEAIATLGIPHKLDVTLPLARLADFCEAVSPAVRSVAADAHVLLFGHLGDGNLHVNVIGPDPADDATDDVVLRLVAELGGSISAEHGIGRAKTRWLRLCRSDAEIAAFRAVKAALDPVGILNPGVLLP